jgi:hypothetical protein
MIATSNPDGVATNGVGIDAARRTENRQPLTAEGFKTK